MSIETKLGLILILVISVLSSAQDIFDAVKKGDVESVALLLNEDPEKAGFRDETGRTPLHWAARGVHYNVLKLLIERGADVNAPDVAGVLPLHSVALRGHPEAAELLIATGADVNAVDSTGNTPLSYALSSSHDWEFPRRREVVDLLLAHGVEVPVSGEEGRITLHRAAEAGYAGLVKAALDRGADAGWKNNDDGTLLHSLAAGNLHELIAELLDKGADINARDRYFMTPLHIAALKGRAGTIDFLLSRGADINVGNRVGQTPFHFASEAGDAELEMYFQVKGGVRQVEFPEIAGEYVGQAKPGKEPELFALGIVSSAHWDHGAPSFSADGAEVYFSWADGTRGANLVMRLVNGIWTAPEYLPFTKIEYREVNATLSRDGRRLFFVSQKPTAENPERSFNIWMSERSDSGWGEPELVGPSRISNGSAAGWSTAESGALYFIQWALEGGAYASAIYRTEFIDGEYAAPEKLSDEIRVSPLLADPMIAPDESFLVFSAQSAPGGLGGFDLYISFSKPDGSWTRARSLGPIVNSAANDEFPGLSPDGKYFFFASDRNGNWDTYWMEAGFLQELKTDSGQ